MPGWATNHHSGLWLSKRLPTVDKRHRVFRTTSDQRDIRNFSSPLVGNIKRSLTFRCKRHWPSKVSHLTSNSKPFTIPSSEKQPRPEPSGATDGTALSARIIFAILVIAIAIVFAPRLVKPVSLAVAPKAATQSTAVSHVSPSTPAAATMGSAAKRLPVYFVSHGGPNIMFDYDHPAHLHLKKIGKEIVAMKPKAVVVFSAHWQAPGRDKIQVNTAVMKPLIYDYYGFPSHYYKVQFPNTGSKELSNKILELLKEKGIKSEGVERGLDHGVFAPFKTMFDDNELNVPIVQVSLFGSEDADSHYELGAALQPLREDGVVIIGSGMAVHNLRDMHFAFGTGKEMPYAKPFDKAIKEAVVGAPDALERKRRLRELLWDKNARNAHPTFEHLLPIHIAAGAADEDKATRVFTMTEMSFSWAQYRFGEIPRGETA